MKTFYRTLIALFTIHCSLFTFSYAQEIEWQNTIGGSDYDILYSIQQTSDGGYIFAGKSTSDISGDKTENVIGAGYDYWVVKTDALGNIQWQNTIGGNYSDYLYCIRQTSDGGYILGGISDSNISGDKTENCNGNADYWIVKINSIGIIQWQNSIGGTSGDWLYSVEQTSDGGYILGGMSYSDISGDKTENSNGGYDYWIVKTNSTGVVQWQNTIGGNNSDELYSIKQTNDGGYILGGISSSANTGDKTETWVGLEDYWIVKTDSLGNIIWQNTIGGTGTDVLKSILQTADGGYILGGYSSSLISGDKTDNGNGQEDYWVLKVDSTGNIQWQNSIGGYNSDMLYSVAPTSDGGFILGGTSKSNISGDKTEACIGNTDYWVVRIDAAGTVLWENTIGGSHYDELSEIQQTVDGGYIIGGHSQSNISGDKTENCIGWNDYWILKLSDRYNSITGKYFLDINSNNVQDSGEVYLANKKIIETNTAKLVFTNQYGNYWVSVLDSGSYSVVPESINYLTAIPASYNVIFNGVQQIDSLNDFAFQPTGVINDLRITITPLTQFRSGFNARYAMHYENVGTTTKNASIVFYLNDSNYTFVSSPTNPSLVTTDSIVWNNITLTPFQSGDITVTVHVNTGVPIGTQLNAFCVIEPVAGDATPGDNYGSWKVFTTGSIDPNDILVDEDTLLSTLFPNPPYLEYIIRFQNTGNDTAFNVKILNTIDTNKLNLSSFEFVASSHPVNLKWITWERNMEFKFDNILLPDSNINEPLSHGYVRYRIKPKTALSVGDSVLNNAAIYFDFNYPVLTNTVKTEIVLPTTYATISASACMSYLSPSGNYVWIASGTYTDTLVNVYGGDSIITVNLSINNSSSIINVTNCSGSYSSPSGNYTWANSGVYYDTIPNATGCDSLITINLNVTTVDTTVTFNTPSLTANATGAAYQWMYCDSTLISGANGQNFTATSNGMYAVIVTQNNCTDTSSCYTVMNVGIGENNSPNGFMVFPNPSSNSITVRFTLHKPQKASLKIYDINGRCFEIIADKNFNAGENKLTCNVSNLDNGVYMLRFQTEAAVENKKLIVQK